SGALAALALQHLAEVLLGAIDEAPQLARVDERVRAALLHALALLGELVELGVRGEEDVGRERAQAREAALVIRDDRGIGAVAHQAVDDGGAAVKDDAVRPARLGDARRPGGTA